MRHTTALLLMPLALIGCASAPESDTTPPTADLFIQYHDVRGQPHTLSTRVDNPVDNVQASKDYPITVIYKGADDEGLRTLNLESTFAPATHGISSSDDDPIAITLDKPRKTIKGVHVFEPQPDAEPGVYTLTTRSANWLGLTTETQTFKIITQ